MALNPADIATVSRLLDDVLALGPADRETWLAALPAEHQRHVQALRDMLGQQARLDSDLRLASMPRVASDEAVAHANDRVGPYRLLHEIGRGGMGSVWLAERADGAYKRQVALKLPRLAWGAGVAERMSREREIGMLLEHPNIARLYDAGVDERGRPFLALEYIDGQPIDAWCEAQGLTVRKRLTLFVQVVKAMAYAHGRLVVHRDLKPSNVLVTSDGKAHLLDFGIAKLLLEVAPGEPGLTQERGRVLTPHYASPEQVAGQAITVQSDVYSLGVLLYELLTGTLPIAPKRSTLGAVEEAILEGDAPAASSRVKSRVTAKALRGEVDAILAKAMQRVPGQRYATADALALDIELHLRGDTVMARPDRMAYRLRKTLRRHWVGVSAATAVLVAIVTGCGVAVVQAKRATRSAERERVVKAFVADVFRVNTRVDPMNAGLRPQSTQSLLEGGARLIQQRFSGQPELQAELYGIVGEVFSQMAAYRLAAEYSTRQIEALTLLRASNNDQASALLALASALFSDDRINDAEPRLRRVLDLSTGDELTKLNAMILLARLHSVRGDFVQGRATLDLIEKRLIARGPAPTVPMGWIVFLRGDALAVENRLDEAIPLYQRGIDIARAAQGALSVDAIQMGLGAAQSMARTAYTKEAQQLFNSAIEALHALGGAHEVRAALASARFAYTMFAEGQHGTYSDTVYQLDRSRAELTRSDIPIPPWFLARVQFWTGSLRGQVGDIVGAEPLLESSAPELQRTGETPFRTMELAIPMAHVMLHAGRYEVAAQWASRLTEARRKAGGERHPYAAWDHILIGQILNMQGRSTEALARLDAAPVLDPMRGDGADPERFNKYLAQARAAFRLESGDTQEAIRLLESIDHGEEDADEFLMSYSTVLGQTLCNSKRRTEGLKLLKQRLAASVDANFASAPWRARLLSVTGLCAAGAGDRGLALMLAGQARSIITAQSAVSSYYKTPLLKLERTLGLKSPPF